MLLALSLIVVPIGLWDVLSMRRWRRTSERVARSRMKYPVYLLFRREPTAPAEQARRHVIVASTAVVVLGWTILVLFSNSH